MFDLRAKRDLNHGFGNAMGRAFELAVTPVIFGGIGWLVDRAAGTHFVFTVGLAIFAIVGMGVRMWLGYDTEMRRHENEMFGVRTTGRTVDAGAGPRAQADARAQASARARKADDQ